MTDCERTFPLKYTNPEEVKVGDNIGFAAETHDGTIKTVYGVVQTIEETDHGREFIVNCGVLERVSEEAFATIESRLAENIDDNIL